jgi:4-hydroxythreonine-4-phosphate dehydrogenase
LCLALADCEFAERIVFVADPAVLESRAAILGRDVSITGYDRDDTADPGTLCVLPITFPEKAECGKLNPANAAQVLEGLRRAAQGCLSGEFSALVTGPVQKSVINDAGIPFTGHTEFLAELTGAELPVMLLTSGTLRVALATTHLPLRAVPDAITTEGIVQVVGILHRGLQSRFGIDNPAIVVCGLNPHAGEGGHLGHEDEDVIVPAVEACRADGIDVRGPLPADTAFTPAAGPADAVLAMYHDQGLPVIKHAGFGNVVNVTLGLPIIRTSVDHGTALDLAGKGTADPGSLVAAARLAVEIAGR